MEVQAWKCQSCEKEADELPLINQINDVAKAPSEPWLCPTLGKKNPPRASFCFWRRVHIIFMQQPFFVSRTVLSASKAASGVKGNGSQGSLGRHIAQCSLIFFLFCFSINRSLFLSFSLSFILYYHYCYYYYYYYCYCYCCYNNYFFYYFHLLLPCCNHYCHYLLLPC